MRKQVLVVLTCCGAFLIVQNGAGADAANSSIGYDETLGNDSGGTLSNSTVGHDVKVGFNGFMGAGPATIGNDLIGPAVSPGARATSLAPLDASQGLTPIVLFPA